MCTMRPISHLYSCMSLFIYTQTNFSHSDRLNPLTTANIKREFSEIAQYFYRHFRVH